MSADEPKACEDYCRYCGRCAPLSHDERLCEACFDGLYGPNEAKRRAIRAVINGEVFRHWLDEFPQLRATVRERLPCAAAGVAKADAWAPTAERPWLVLHGVSHLGKTRLGVLVAERLAAALRCEPLAMWPGQLGMIVAEAWCDGEVSAAAVLRRWSVAPLVLLDDIDKVKPTERACEFLLAVLKARAARGLPTIITTNLVGAEFRAQFGEKHGAPIANELVAYSRAIGLQARADGAA